MSGTIPIRSSPHRGATQPAPDRVAHRPPSVKRQAFWSVLTQGLGLLCAVATAVLLNRALMPEGRGQVAALSLWPLILAMLAIAGWSNANTWYVSRHPNKARAVWSSTILVGLVTAAVMMLAGYVLMPLLLGQYPRQCHLARWYLAVIPAHAILMAATSVLEGLGRFNRTLWLRAGTAMLRVSALAGLVCLGALTCSTYVVFQMAACYTIAGISVAVIVTTTQGSWRPEWSERPRFALRDAPQAVAKLAFDQCGLVLVTCVLVPDAKLLGIFVASVSVAHMMVPVTVGVSMVLLPETARRSRKNARILYRKAVLFLLVGAVVIGLPVVVFSDLLLGLAFGQAYAAGAGFLRLSIVATAVMALLGFGTATAQGLGRPGLGTIANGVAAACGIGLAAALLFPLGLYGIILGKLMGCVLGVGVLQYMLEREFAKGSRDSECQADSKHPRADRRAKQWHRWRAVGATSANLAMPHVPHTAPAVVARRDAVAVEGDAVPHRHVPITRRRPPVREECP